MQETPAGLVSIGVPGPQQEMTRASNVPGTSGQIQLVGIKRDRAAEGCVPHNWGLLFLTVLRLQCVGCPSCQIVLSKPVCFLAPSQLPSSPSECWLKTSWAHEKPNTLLQLPACSLW